MGGVMSDKPKKLDRDSMLKLCVMMDVATGKSRDNKRYCDKEKITYTIYNNRFHEIDVHSRLLITIGSILLAYPGFEVQTEVTIGIGKKKNRIDLMVFLGKFPICGIEVKRNQTVKNPLQTEFYEQFQSIAGIPIFYCRGLQDVGPIAHKVKAYIDGRVSNAA
jgi:hypothetical protein